MDERKRTREDAAWRLEDLIGNLMHLARRSAGAGNGRPRSDRIFHSGKKGALRRAATQMRDSRLVQIMDRIGSHRAPHGQACCYSRNGDYRRASEQQHDRTVSTYAEN